MTSASIAVFDIDGVVADVRHRLHYLSGRHKNWSGFFAAAGDDPPLETGVNLVHDLAQQHDIVWLTGRPDWLRSVTEDWLRESGFPAQELHMRPVRDHRPARQYKIGRLRLLGATRSIAAFVDDDDQVVDAALAAGFPAVLADWVPRAEALRDAQDRLGRS